MRYTEGNPKRFGKNAEAVVAYFREFDGLNSEQIDCFFAEFSGPNRARWRAILDLLPRLRLSAAVASAAAKAGEDWCMDHMLLWRNPSRSVMHTRILGDILDAYPMLIAAVDQLSEEERSLVFTPLEAAGIDVSLLAPPS